MVNGLGESCGSKGVECRLSQALLLEELFLLAVFFLTPWYLRVQSRAPQHEASPDERGEYEDALGRSIFRWRCFVVAIAVLVALSEWR